MLSIILTVLKIVGIIAASLFLFLLLVVLALLFLPFSYRIRAKKEGALADASASVQIAWLFHAVRLKAAYQGGTPAVSLYILWFHRTLFPRKDGGMAGRGGRRKKRTVASVPQTKERASRESPGGEETPGEGPKEKRKADREHKTEERTPRFLRFPGKCLRVLQGFFGRFASFFRSAVRRAENFRHSFQKRRKSLSAWIALARSEMTAEVFRILRRHLRYLVRHIRPRTARGELHYGLEDPAMTGWLTGALYLLLPAGKRIRLQLTPDFDHAVFTGQADIRGHIRIWHIAKTAIQIFFDQTLRTYWKRIERLRRK